MADSKLGELDRLVKKIDFIYAKIGGKNENGNNFLNQRLRLK